MFFFAVSCSEQSHELEIHFMTLSYVSSLFALKLTLNSMNLSCLRAFFVGLNRSLIRARRKTMVIKLMAALNSIEPIKLA